MKKILSFILFIILILDIQAQALEKTPLHRLTKEEYEATLDFWENKYPDLLTVERVGESMEGLGIFLLKITNKKIADRNKQVALISSLHGGPERSGTASILKLAEWLLSDDQEAAEIRKKQLVLLMPIVNPYAFFISDSFGNSNNICPYHQNWKTSDWNLDDVENITYKNIDKSPEMKAFFDVVDQYKPEVNLDLHGTGIAEFTEEQKEECNYLQYKGNIMFESVGGAYSNLSLRPWDWRITEAIVQAGKDAGFPSDRLEADGQRLYRVQDSGNAQKWFWTGIPRFYTAQYAYLKYHTMPAILEVAWVNSGFAKAKGFLKIGNAPWFDEKEPGYPVNKVLPRAGNYVTSWGHTAQERRDSRVELWQRQDGLVGGILYPRTDGRFFISMGFTEKGVKLLDHDLSKFISNLKKNKTINASFIESFIKKGPEVKLGFPKYDETSLKSEYIKNGVGIRLRLQYADAKIEDLRLNGHLLKVDPEDGYETWVGDGFLQVQINIPPGKSSQMDAAIITCEYSTDTKREYDWVPPRK